MRRFLVLASLLLGIAGSVSAQSLSSRLQELDAVVRDKDTYDRLKEERISAIRSSFSGIEGEDRYEICDAMFREYAKFNLDSALFYAREKAAYAAKYGNKENLDHSLLQQADIYINASLFNEARDLIDQVSHHNAFYYHTLHSLYSALAGMTAFQKEAAEYYGLKNLYRDSLIRSLPATDLGNVYASAEKMNDEGNYYDAIQLLTSNYNDPATNDSDKAILDYCLAISYKGLNNREKAKWHYATSAIADLRTPVKEYRSLQELAFMLYEDGDLSRAYEYISCAMEDVLSSNTLIRSVEFAPILSTISEAYEKDIRRRSQVQRTLVWILSGLIVLLAFVTFLAFRQRHDISRANRRLREVNEELVSIYGKLKETGYLKEAYLYQYMEQAAASIDKLDAYRRKSLLTYRKYGAESLVKELETPFDVETELRAFYHSFDETFLHIFPDFVEDVNNLLKPEFRLEPKPGRLLNTELRILALIRLGVTDNVKMSHFLRTSLSTIYNYRSKLRNGAVSDPGEFEENVARIGEMIID